MLMTALLFASAVAAPPRQGWSRHWTPEPKPQATETRKAEPEKAKPEKQKPPSLCKRFPYACLSEALGPPDDYQNGGPDGGSGGGGY